MKTRGFHGWRDRCTVPRFDEGGDSYFSAIVRSSSDHTSARDRSLSSGFTLVGAPTAAGTVGGLSLTPVDGPGFWNVDAALTKRTRFKERLGVELRLETFNVFNHANFSVGNSQDINSTSFGKINAAFENRIIQWAWKFTF